jgi:phytoene dehydrogenase-like protein
MAEYLRCLGGEVETGRFITDIEQVLVEGKTVLLDQSPRQILRVAGDHFSPNYQLQLASYRYGPGVFKLDLALDGPIPWKAQECSLAGTVHVGGTMEEIIESERLISEGKHPRRPFVLVAQTSQFDPTRAPDGNHAIWTYCHVPNGSTVDMSEIIEAQIERFAPGFRDRIIARHKMTAMDMQDYNPNYVGGDINSGMQNLRQLFTRPAVRIDPYSTPSDRIYICSSATPPGGGVHGMCGYYAALSAMKRSSGEKPIIPSP